MNKIKTIVITTGRADYGLLCPLLKLLSEHEKFDLHIAATGSHTSHSQGYTLAEIKKSGFKNIDVVDMCPENDKEHDICLAISKGLSQFSQLYKSKKTDLIIVLGDRYELWSACMPAVVYKIPIAHIHGGESTYGVIDDSIRHSITKMSQFHFASIVDYANRIIYMGENPKNVFVVGALGIDNIINIPLMAVDELSEFTKVDFKNKDVAIMTYHPVTLDDYSMAVNQIIEVIEAIIKTNLFTIITMPNTDPAGKTIYEKIMEYVLKFPEKLRFIKNLGQKAYLSSMYYSKLMIGNSSSGIIESASFKLPVVNIGDRQAGRLKPENVISCQCKQNEILCTIQKALSKDFINSISELINPYGDGKTAPRIVKILDSIDIKKKSNILKKVL